MSCVTDAEGHVTTTRYYPDGKVWKVIDAEGHDTVVNRYYGNGSLKEVQDAKGNITQYEYNGFMALKKTTYPDDTYEEVTYDEYRRVRSVRGRSGQTIGSSYDGLNRVSGKTVEYPGGGTFNEVVYKYDMLGRLYRVTDNTGTTKNTYDKAGRLIRVRYPDGKTVSYQYDAAGNRTRLTYPDSTYITYDYDELNRMTAVRDSNGVALASYTFDDRSRRTALTYANGASAAYTYDTASRLLELDNQTNNGQHKYSYLYDNVGNRWSMQVTDSNGVRTHVYSYDNIYQITDVNYPAELSYLATDTGFTYDEAGNRTSVIDGSGTCSYTTNDLNQYTAAGTTSYTYDDSGNMTADGRYGYTYDPENRLLKVTKDASGQGTPPAGMALGKAVDSLLTYTTGGDSNWLIDGASHSVIGSAQSGGIDDDQQSWLQTQVVGAGTLSFWWKVSSESACDFLQLWIDGVLRNNVSGQEETWAQETYTLTGSGAHTIQWRYQKDGSDSEGSDCGWVDEVQWSGPIPEDPSPDDWGRTPYVFNAGLTYVYDAAGRRIEKKYDGTTVLKYVYDGDHCIAEYDTSGDLRRKYIYGPGVDQPICMIENTQTYAGTYYYHFDALGSVVTLTNSSGNTAEVYEYDVYGRVGASDPNHPNRFLFTGREYDKETGLYYYRARYYNPQIGRFLQTDPIGYKVGMNLYRYCENTPLTLIDPMGKQALPPNFWPPYGPDAPAGSSDGLEARAEALILLIEWLSGTGPETRKIGDEWKITAELKKDWRVEEARQFFRAANSGKPRSEWVSVTPPWRTFGLKAHITYAMDPLLLFGSFEVTVSTSVTVAPGEGGPSDSNDKSDELETITVKNTTSWTSFWRFVEVVGIDPPESWTRAECQFCGNINQAISWQEDVLKE